MLTIFITVLSSSNFSLFTTQATVAHNINRSSHKIHFNLIFSSMADSVIFQYIPFKSIVAPDFWYKVAENKLDFEKLDEHEKEIFGTFTNCNAKNCLLEVDCTAFNRYSVKFQ